MKRRRLRRKSVKRFKVYFIFAATVFIISLAVMVISERMLPLANAMAITEAKNRINSIIYDTIYYTVVESDIVTSDFYNKTEDAAGNVTSLTVNTVLVNALCAEVAENISEAFQAGESQKVSIPMGTLTGIGVFSNLGPQYSVKMLPAGNVIVDYETKFEAVGINQINFQVWLNVAVKTKIVNPMQKDEAIVERKVSLVNTVFSGKVPENFIGGIPIDVGN